MTSGVYAILNVQTAQRYVGCSSHIEERWERHCHMLEDGIHPNYLLQSAYDMFPDKLAFIVLELTAPESMYRREQVWIDRLIKFHDLYNLDLGVKNT
jgi:hypothetical protein